MTLLNAADLAVVAQGYDPVPERSYSIDAACYREPKYHEADRQAIFHRSWQFLCHAEKLRELGSYLAADIQGQSVFAVRDGQGVLRAFYNVCKHRAHELVSGEGKKKLITCPYHAWVYGLDGALVHAPADAAVSITGIAGPGGATAHKPVGLVFIGGARRGGTAVSERHVFPGDRSDVRTASVAAALAMLRGLLDRTES